MKVFALISVTHADDIEDADSDDRAARLSKPLFCNMTSFPAATQVPVCHQQSDRSIFNAAGAKLTNLDDIPGNSIIKNSMVFTNRNPKVCSTEKVDKSSLAANNKEVSTAANCSL